MDTIHDNNHRSPPVQLNSTPLDMESSNVIPYMDEEEVQPVSSPPSSQTGTLKAHRTSKSRSPKCSPLAVNKESSIPVVKRDTEKVMEMFLKRRSMSMNDAILQKEFFTQERRKKKDRGPRNNTVSICSTKSTDSSDYRTSGNYEEQILTRSKGSFSRALQNSVLPEDAVKREQSSADDELSSSDHEIEKEKSRSAPSTLRLQVGKLTEDDIEKLRAAGNGYAQAQCAKKESLKRRDVPKRRKSLLDKAKQIMRSPSLQRKHEGTQAPVGPDETSASRSKVHQEMKHTGFANRLKRTFRRDQRKSSVKSNDSDAKIKMPTPPQSASSESKDSTKTRRWPSFQFRRRPRKSVSTPTDDSLAGATPSDTTSNADWVSASDYDHTKSMTEYDRRKLLKEIHGGVRLRPHSVAVGSDLQLSGNHRDPAAARNEPLPEAGSNGAGTPSSLLSSSQESGLSSDWSSGSGQKKQRPRSLNLTRSKRQARAKQGLNDVLKLDRTTPGHVRRDTDTRQPVMPTASGSGEGDVTDNMSQEDLEIDGHEEQEEGNEDATLQRPSKKEREEYYKRIADRLAQIGDQVVTQYQGGVVAADREGSIKRHEGQRSCASTIAMATSSSGAVGGASMQPEEGLYRAIGENITDHVDGYRMSLMCVVSDRTYNVFRDTVQSLIGQDTGFEQLALVFKFTKLAMKIAQHWGAKASEIKENSLRFIVDQFAEWIDSQGGWGAIMESDSEDENSHQESEID